MKKKGLLKGIVLSAACLLVFGTLIGATTGLFQNKTYEIAEAATETKATLTKDNIIAASSSEATINGITFDWGDTEFTVSGSTLSVDADHAANILVFSSGLSSNNVTHVSVNISYTAPALNTTLQIIEGFTNKLVNISLTGTSYSSGDVSIDNSKTLMIKIMNNGKDQLNNLTISSFSLDLKGIPAKSAVTIAKGTGVKSVYLSTSNTATSGSASETEYDNGTTVYGFAELAKGYKAKSGWKNVSGTADTEGAKYRVGSVSAGSSNFGTISADLISYSIGYTLNSGSVSGTNPTSYNVTTNNFTLINPTKTGYTFNGWSGTGISGTSTSVTVSKGSIGNRTYTANWSANKYTITYKDGGDKTFSGTHEDGYPTTHTYGTTTTLKSATKTGYTFDGWFTNSGCSTGNKVTSLGATAYTANITLYAK